MDSTPQDERVSELAGLDPADAVAPAQDLADELEASLAEPEAAPNAAGSDDAEMAAASDPLDPPPQEGAETDPSQA